VKAESRKSTTYRISHAVYRVCATQDQRGTGKPVPGHSMLRKNAHVVWQQRNQTCQRDRWESNLPTRSLQNTFLISIFSNLVSAFNIFSPQASRSSGFKSMSAMICCRDEFGLLSGVGSPRHFRKSPVPTATSHSNR
jgi:hypothetical protein